MGKTIFENDEFLIYEYDTSLGRLYIKGIDNMYFQKKVRFLLNHLSGGSIYYLKDKATDREIGYCMVSKGRSFHYRYARPDDITIGPIYLTGDYRGRRLSVLLLEQVLEQYPDSGSAYAYIHRINKQSNALFSRAGFVPECGAVIARLSRQVSRSEDENTDYRLYRLDLKKR